MTTVEELMNKIMMRHTTYVPDHNERWAVERNEIHIPTREELNELVDFARAEGFAECKEEGIEGLQVTFKETLAKARAEGFAEGVEDTTADLALVQDAEMFAQGRAEGAEQVKADLEKWLMEDSNEYVSVTHYTTTYTARHVNIETVIDFLHDCLDLKEKP